MRLLALLLAAAVAAPTLAGCVSPPDEPASTAGDAPQLVANLTAPVVDAAEVVGAVKGFSEAFPMRRGDNEAHNGARAFLLATYEELGYTTFEDEFAAPVSPLSTPTNIGGSTRLVNIVGIKWGVETPEEWIVVGAHYDVTDGAYFGAYDDGSGTMIVQALARAFADVPTERTIVFINFDGEEQGLRGSAHMVESMAEGSWVLANGTVVGMIDFDMAGIMYPADPPLVADVVSPEMEAVIDRTREALEIPAEKVEYRPISGGSSDNGPFKGAEIPSVLFISDFDEVVVNGVAMPQGVTYPFWHQLDSYQGMVEMAGGEEKLVAGFQNVIDIGAALLLEMANGLAMTFDGPE